MTNDEWWKKPRHVSVVVDNDSWVLPYAEQVVARARIAGDEVTLARSHQQIEHGAVAFYLGCMRITPPEILARNRRNLVVHASDLPKGRGFSPMTWLILEGHCDIPVCLLEASEQVDCGLVVYREIIHLEGHELNGEIRNRLGLMHIELCLRFLNESVPPVGVAQEGEPTYYRRRYPAESRLDPQKSIADQFDLLRVVDNERHPAFFEYRGKCYRLTIDKMTEKGSRAHDESENQTKDSG